MSSTGNSLVLTLCLLRLVCVQAGPSRLLGARPVLPHSWRRAAALPADDLPLLPCPSRSCPAARWAAQHPEAAEGAEGGVLAVVDAPIWMHWRKAWLWLAMEAVVIAGCVTSNRNSDRWTEQLVAAGGPDCTNETGLECKKSGEGAQGLRWGARAPPCPADAHARRWSVLRALLPLGRRGCPGAVPTPCPSPPTPHCPSSATPLPAVQPA